MGGSTMYWNFLSGADGADGIEVKEGGLASDFFIANTYHGISIGQYLDTQCISMMKGTNYQAEGWSKLSLDITLPLDWANYKSIFLYVKADSASNLWLDNFSLKREDYDMDASLTPTNKPSMQPSSTNEKIFSSKKIKYVGPKINLH